MKEAGLKLSDEISSDKWLFLQKQMNDSLQNWKTGVIIIIIIVALIEHRGLRRQCADKSLECVYVFVYCVRVCVLARIMLQP